ncbi:hypothetical protein, partial [Candidatus Binatus sp.]|uniref:hypothetical protein n=1 Tax=Candidatus Binatus sp. TaxID=2811406 RepID=UPI003C4B9966
QHASEAARGRHEGHQIKDVSEKGIPVKTRGRRGAGAATGAMRPNRPVKQGKLKLIPDRPD